MIYLEDFESIVEEFGNDVYNFCIYLAKNKDDGEDLFQETIIKALELSSKINRDKNPKSYLLSIAINTWKNTVRKRARRNLIGKYVRLNEDNSNAIPDMKTNVEDSVIDSITNATLLETLNKLDDKYRITIILFYLENMKIAEIAKVLDRPEGTIKRQLHEGKSKMKKQMEVLGYE